MLEIKLSDVINCDNFVILNEKKREQKIRTGLRYTKIKIINIYTNEMRKKKSGRRYKRNGKIHIASAINEVPATDTGLTLQGIKANSFANYRNIVIEDNSPYAISLHNKRKKHFGYLDEQRPKIEKLFNNIFSKLVQNS